MTSLASYTRKIRKEFPDFEIKEKSKSRLMKAINVFLRIITFGQMKTFMTTFTTTVSETIYTPSNWPKLPEGRKVRILRHEVIHLRQKKRYTFLLFGFLYIFCPLPFGLAYFRMKFEREAYEETLRAIHEESGIVQLRNDKKLRESIISNFTTAKYFWMWPFRRSIEKWYDDTLTLLSKGL